MSSNSRYHCKFCNERITLDKGVWRRVYSSYIMAHAYGNPRFCNDGNYTTTRRHEPRHQDPDAPKEHT